MCGTIAAMVRQAGLGWIAAGMLLVLHASLVSWSIWRNAVTLDETNHLPAGVAYLEQREFALYHQNPPLLKALAGAAALAAGAQSDYAGHWRFSKQTHTPLNYVGFGLDFQSANADPPGHYHAIFRAARLVVLGLSLIGGLLVFLWSRELFGVAGGLVSLALWCLSPNVIAHAGLVTIDIAATVAAFGATYAFWAWLRHWKPTWPGAIRVGLLLGLAQLVKFTSLILLPIWSVLVAIGIWRGAEHDLTPLERARRLAGPGAVMLLTSILTINLGYLFEGSGRRLGSFEFLSTELTVPRVDGLAPNQQSIYRDVYRDRQNRFRHTPLADLRVPLPAEYVAGFDEQSFEANPRYPGFGFTFYMAGELSKLGSPLYYLYALVLKSTPGALLLCALGLWGLWRVRLPLTTEAFLLLPPIAMLLAMSLLTEINLGVRYTLVCFPYAMVALGRVAKLESPRGVRVLVPLLLALHAGSALWIAPHFLAYFNPFAGGPASGHERLVDSNLDWGQDLLALAEFDKEREQGEPLHVALYTNLSPAASGLDLPLIPRDPAALSAAQRHARDPNELPALVPGLYALSVNYAVGLPFRMLFEERVFSVPRNAYSYLRRLEPVGRVGYSIWLYRLSQKDCDQLNSELGFERGGER